MAFGQVHDMDVVTHAVPKLHTALDGYVVANHHIIFNQYLRTDIAVRTNLGFCKNYAKLPDARAFTNIIALHIG